MDILNDTKVGGTEPNIKYGDVAIICMQKDEDDILREWILYHAHVFGLNNLFIIDHNSGPKSLKILAEFRPLGLNVFTHLEGYTDYSRKGDYICDLIQQLKHRYTVAIPLDLDEFIGVCDGITNQIQTIKDCIWTELSSLPLYGRYAFAYYLTSRNTELLYPNPIIDIIHFDRIDMSNHPITCGHNGSTGNYNKKFFLTNTLLGLDHGHHLGTVEGLQQGDVYATNLVLFHFHFRGIRKLLQKCRNDMMGLGVVKNPNDIKELKSLIDKGIPGSHNIATYLRYLEQGIYACQQSIDDAIEIISLSETMSNLKRLQTT
jgi:hypothetical protein